MRDGTPIGVIVLTRNAVRPFTDKQIELVTTFADQAVIAIENARLFEAEQQRTRELTESLEQQTATSDVLRVISSSPGDLQSVFAAMLENAVRICDAKFGNIHRWDGDVLRLAATHNTPPAYAEMRKRYPFRPDAGNPTSRMMRSKTVIYGLDLLKEETYIKRRDPGTIAAVEIGGVRTFLIVPMLKGDELIGSFNLFRQEVRPFTDKQIELVQSFRGSSCHCYRERGCSTSCVTVPKNLVSQSASCRRSESVKPLTPRSILRPCSPPSSPRRCSSPTLKPVRFTFSTSLEREFRLRATYGMN